MDREHVLGSGVVEELEVVPAETEGDGGGDQQDGGRAPTEVGLPALHSISLFTFHCCQACCQKTDRKTVDLQEIEQTAIRVKNSHFGKGLSCPNV